MLQVMPLGLLLVVWVLLMSEQLLGGLRMILGMNLLLRHVWVGSAELLQKTHISCKLDQRALRG